MSEKMTIYLNDQRKANIDTLLKALVKDGVADVQSSKGPSISAMYDYLVREELKRRRIEVKQ